MTRKLPFPVAAIFVLSVPAAGQVPAGSPVVPSAARFEWGLRPAGKVTGQTDPTFSIAERMRYWNVPAISVAVIDSFRVVYARGFGVTEFGGTVAVDTTTLFQAGSISKPVFAAGALRLVELEEPLAPEEHDERGQDRAPGRLAHRPQLERDVAGRLATRRVHQPDSGAVRQHADGDR